MPANEHAVASSASSKPPSPDRNVKSVVLGNIRFKTWFHSLYPEELVGKDTDRIYVCRWCFRYSCDKDAYLGHTRFCEHRSSPPGTKVYDWRGYSVWEIDGEDHKLYAQNLSLFAKLFLDHKSVFFDVSSFLYYILVFTNPQDANDYHVLGYFSKEKMSWDANNLACILIFPPYQHKQLGKLLMGVSYKLSAWEWEGGIIGGPERPLSEMGRRSYVRFWEERISRFFLLGPPGAEPYGRNIASASTSSSWSPRPMGGDSKGAKRKAACEEMTIREIGQATGMLVEDVITALKEMGIVESEKPGKKRKRAPLSSTATTTTATGVVDSDAAEAVVRKQSVLEWAKIHRVDLKDPVAEEGFLGEWAPEDEDQEDEETDSGD
ncbi:histone acetyltransferase Tip60 [Histoplasma capsulatum H143]|uniref:histone acetyltransferase n=1 Tax=Ajellomyces capsulatus (strain H143) TaxID=544712 RepID=C6H774_AJECH|nr:histone acetyltransferase Tip60 [Histoplasma capsulatum H143]